MNRAQYEQYEKDVAAFMETEGINCLTTGPEESESFFSWRECECCGDTKGGDREKASGFNPTTKEVQEYDEVCRDCLYYAAYGELGDDTMMSLDDE